MELVKAALAEALRLLRLHGLATTLQGSVTPDPTRDRYTCQHIHSNFLGALGHQVNLLSPQQHYSSPRTATYMQPFLGESRHTDRGRTGDGAALWTPWPKQWTSSSSGGQ